MILPPLFAAAVAAAAPAPMLPNGPIVLTIKDHRFTPSEVVIPAGEKVQILLVNQDAAAEEFDSDDLKKEEFVAPKGRIRFSLGPLKPGRYAFQGEYHADTASGVVVAVEPGTRP